MGDTHYQLKVVVVLTGLTEGTGQSIVYRILERTTVYLKLSNTIGHRDGRLINEEVSARVHENNFRAIHLPSGLYIYRLQTGEYVESRKMLYLK